MVRARKNLGDRAVRHDAAYRQAKQDNFAARAVYKLAEIDKKFHIFKPGQRVLDLGCWPGSWMQYAAEKIGSEGYLLGLDREAVDCALPAWATTLVADVWEWNPETYFHGDFPRFDVLLSDLAPKTTGDRHADQWRSEELYLRAFELAQLCLRPGGHFVGKVFQGPRFAQLAQETRQRFQAAKAFHPKATRERSKEQYIIGRGLKSSTYPHQNSSIINQNDNAS